MNYAEIIDALRYETARLALGKMDDEKVVQLIDELTRQGVYFDEFLDVLSRPYYRPDFLKAMKASLVKLEIEVPTNASDAVWILLKRNISRMVENEYDPLINLEELITDVYWDFDFHSLTTEYLGDSHGIEYLIGLYWGYDDLSIKIRSKFSAGIRNRRIQERDKNGSAELVDPIRNRVE